MRALFIVFLLSTVLLQGFAAARALPAECPMSAGITAMHDLGDATGAAQDCCNDAATVAKTGALCKVELLCFSAGLGAIEWFPPLHAAAPAVTHIFTAPSLLLNHLNPAAVWRPPALI